MVPEVRHDIGPMPLEEPDDTFLWLQSRGHGHATPLAEEGHASSGPLHLQKERSSSLAFQDLAVWVAISRKALKRLAHRGGTFSSVLCRFPFMPGVSYPTPD